MSEGLATPDGKPLELGEVDTEFARAMAAPPKGGEKAPPRRSDDHPAEKAESAPRVADAKRPRGRPRKDGTPAGSPRPANPSAAVLGASERKQAVAGIVQLGAGVCMLASRATGQESFKADAVVLASSADEISTAVADTCDQDERLARIVDKIASVGPYGALLTVTFSVAAQIARNHGVPAPGTHDPKLLLEMAEAQEEMKQAA